MMENLKSPPAMIKQVMILGATGNFGSKIAKSLAKANIPLIIGGRQVKKLQQLKEAIQQRCPALSLHAVAFDIKTEFSQQLKILKPLVVINTCGPFQSADYSIATECIHLGIHYIDLADGRDFVNGIHSALNSLAMQKHCLVVSGASTVPCLSSAVLEHYKKDFHSIDTLVFGISPGQKTERGLATTQAILSYVGKPLLTSSIGSKKIYGWQGLYRQVYPTLGKRWMANCDIPDIDLLPKHYDLKSIQFSAGMESTLLHFSMWSLSWLVRLGIPINLPKHAAFLLKLSHLFDYFGSDEGGMHMIFTGKDKSGKPKIVKWFLIAKNDDGPYVPTIPAIVLAKKLIQGKINQTGAMPCIGLITLEEYLAELNGLNIHIYTQQT